MIQNNYNKPKKKKPFTLITNVTRHPFFDRILIVVGLLALIVYLVSLPIQGQQNFCVAQGYEFRADIPPNKVCINSDTLVYAEIECSGFLNWDCKITSEKKVFKHTVVEDFLDYKVDGFLEK